MPASDVSWGRTSPTSAKAGAPRIVLGDGDPGAQRRHVLRVGEHVELHHRVVVRIGRRQAHRAARGAAHQPDQDDAEIGRLTVGVVHRQQLQVGRRRAGGVLGQDGDRQGVHVGTGAQGDGQRVRRVVVEVGADPRSIDSRAQQHGRRVDRPGADNDRGRKERRPVGEEHTGDPATVEQHPVDERVAADLEVRTIARRLEVDVVHRGPPAVGRPGEQRRLGARIGGEQCPAHCAALRGRRSVKRHGQAGEPRGHVGPGPAGAAELLGPLVVVTRLAAQPDHRVDGRRAADAATAQVHPRLLAHSPPGDEVGPDPSWHLHRGLERGPGHDRRRVGRTVVGAGLEQQHPEVGVLAEAGGDHGAARASPHHDHVGVVIVHVGNVPIRRQRRSVPRASTRATASAREDCIFRPGG